MPIDFADELEHYDAIYDDGGASYAVIIPRVMTEKEEEVYEWAINMIDDTGPETLLKLDGPWEELIALALFIKRCSMKAHPPT